MILALLRIFSGHKALVIDRIVLVNGLSKNLHLVK